MGFGYVLDRGSNTSSHRGSNTGPNSGLNKGLDRGLDTIWIRFPFCLGGRLSQSSENGV